MAWRRPLTISTLATGSVLVGLLVVAVLLPKDSGEPASNAVRLADLKTSPYGVVYLEEHNIFVVSTADGPIALVGDAQHLPDDPVWYCPLSDQFEGPYHGARFDRQGRYVSGPPRRDMDRVALEIADGIVVVDLDTVIASSGRSLAADPAKGPACGGVPEEPGFFPPTPLN